VGVSEVACDVTENQFLFGKTRGDLMDLEKRRSHLQEECITLDGALKKSKQKEVCFHFH
jgi:hypothetical protein